MTDIKTDARDKDATPPEPTPTEMLVAQNAQIIQMLDGIFWCVGGPVIANANKAQYNALAKEQTAAAQKQKMEKKIVTRASMPIPPIDFT